MNLSDQTVKTVNSTGARPQVRGKFIFIGEEKFYLRGVTYGTFSSSEDGSEYFDYKVVLSHLLSEVGLCVNV